VRLLLDTHVVLWSALSPEVLRPECRAAIEDGLNEVYVSVVSAWEIAMKQSLGKLELSGPAEHWLPDVLQKSGFEAIPLELGAALRVGSLPWHHRDPFDRLLVAQAAESACTLATRDAALAAYGVPLLLA
jgi:PIN domain nuclease of toxin-antitoxin system